MNSTETKTIRLLIVDDRQVTRVGLCTFLGACPQFEIVSEAGSVAETMAALNQCNPSASIFDTKCLESRQPNEVKFPNQTAKALFVAGRYDWL